jgi:serine-type D-Ala-D-Ala carboxypeptidase
VDSNANRHLAAIRRLISESQEKGLFSHAQVLAAFKMDDQWIKLEASTHPDERLMFDLASMTKALVTTPIILSQLRKSGLNIDTPIGSWSDTIRTELPHLADIPIISLLQHKSGLPSWRNFWINRLGIYETHALHTTRQSHMIDCLRRITVDPTQIGRFQYSCVGFILLCLASELNSGRTFDKVFDDFISEHLENVGFSNARPMFPVAGTPLEGAVPTAYCHIRKKQLVGEVHDENCGALAGISGNAGLFGSAESVFHLLKDLIATNFGSYLLEANRSYLKQSSDALCGWRRGNGPSAGNIYGGLAMGHTGFTGTVFWVEPAGRGITIVLTNRVMSGRTSSMEAIQRFRRDVLQEVDSWNQAIQVED